MNHYVYLLTDDAESNYIGVRSCKCLIQDDTKYWGSSKYIPDNVRETHNKIILGRFDTRVEAVEKEIFYHNLFDVARNPQFINRAKQTSTGFDTSGITRGPLPLITRKKLSDSRKGIIQTTATRIKISKSLIGNTRRLGILHSTQTKQKMSIKQSGSNHPAYDPTIYTFVHSIYGEFIGTRYQLYNTYTSATQRGTSGLCRHVQKTHNGWRLQSTQKNQQD